MHTALKNFSSPLAAPNFRYLFIAVFTSSFGSRFTGLALPLLVYEITDSPFQLGLSFVVRTVATLLFAMWAGALSDRWNRRKVMITVNIIRATLALSIIVPLILNFSPNIAVIYIYVVNFLMASASQFYVPAKMSIIPQTVPKSQLMAANSLDQGATTMAGVIGYAAAGVLVAAVGVRAAFLLDSATFLISAVCISMIQVEDKKYRATRQTSLLSSVREGVHIIWQTPILRAGFIFSCVAPIAIGAAYPLHVIYAQDVIQVGNAGYGFLQSAISFGVAIGLILVGIFFDQVPRGRLLSYGTALFGFFHLLAILIPIIAMRTYELSSQMVLGTAVPFFVLFAIANGAIFLGVRTLVQENTPNKAIGRVFNAMDMVSNTAFAVGMASSGLVDYVGATMLLVGWMCFMTTVGVGGILWKDFR